MARAAAATVFLLVCASAAAAASVSSPLSRHLLQQQQPASSTNCTPARPVSATNSLPFCFTPNTISAEAQQFLSNASAPALAPPGNQSSPAEAAAFLQTVRQYYRDLMTPYHDAAVKQVLQSVRNDSIANVSVLIAVPKGVKQGPAANTKALLYLHGGGYIIGACDHLLNVPAATAASTGLTIICPEYRLAPEHPFPAGLDDVLTVYKTMIKQGGYKPGNIVLLGDSAGGGLVAAMAVQLQREGVALPAALGMFSPLSDITNRGDTKVTLNAVDPVIAGIDPSQTQQDRLAAFGPFYLAGNASQATNPLVSPVYADFARLFPRGALPPTLIQVGLRETLLSDSVRLYHKMRAAAPAPGHVALSPYEGMWHVWQSYTNLPEAAAASREMGEYFSRALAGHICK